MTSLTRSEVLSKRYDFVLLFDVQDGNPNGDPDAGNLPRIDPQSLQGIVTDGCLKRKIRNAIATITQDGQGNVPTGYDLYFQTQDAVYEKRVLNLIHQSAWDALGLQQSSPPPAEGEEASEQNAEKKPKKGKASKEDKGNFDNVRRAREWMCANFFDIRAFGAVMTTGINCGQVRGPVQITFARSVDPIVPLEYSITRKSVTTTEEAQKQAKNDGTITGTMGRKNTVPYGLYRCSGFINPYLAKDTGFTLADLDLLWAALRGTMWEIDRSASRGLMATRGLYVFEHESALGNAPAHELFDLISIPQLGNDKAPRSFKEYQVTVSDPPKGVTLHRFVG